ncbi:MAG: methionyl-tRNA formyltransferase [Ktedonobacteraceae bacterium]
MMSSELSNRLKRSPRVLFFGVEGSFSWPSLHALDEGGIDVCAIVKPAPRAARKRVDLPAITRLEPSQRRASLPMYDSPYDKFTRFAESRNIPLYEVRRLADPLVVATLAALDPDLICVACFPLRLPRAVLDIPRFGCLNVHPSLLPDNRGPSPLFWVFRLGYARAGVTIHFMDEGFDMGDIVMQEAFPIPEGIGYLKLEAQCAVLGGKLLERSVWEVYIGRAQPVPQDEAQSSYHSYPTAEDFVVPVAEWSADHVYNFFRGTKILGEALKVRVDGKDINIDGAFDYTLDTPKIPPEHRYKNAFKPHKEGNLLWVRCKTGWVCVIAWL